MAIKPGYAIEARKKSVINKYLPKLEEEKSQSQANLPHTNS